MVKEFTGLNTYLYTFDLNEREKYRSIRKRLSEVGTVTEMFIENRLAFEFRVPVRVY